MSNGEEYGNEEIKSQNGNSVGYFYNDNVGGLAGVCMVVGSNIYE